MNTKHPNETLSMLELLRQRISYDQETGILSWKPCAKELFKNELGWAIWHGKFAGKKVKKNTNGYVILTISIDGKERYIQGHRAAWALVTGAWPENEIDHENTFRSDNRWKNLRPATNQQNSWNKSRDKRNRSGFKGVHQHSQNGNWVSQICISGNRKHLGSFDTAEMAAAAYQRAAQANHGQFVRA